MYQEQYFEAPYLGRVFRDQYELLGNFFENEGVNKVISRYPYIAQRPVFSNEFDELWASMLDQPMLALLSGAVNEVICEQSVIFWEGTIHDEFISGETLIQPIQQGLVRDDQNRTIPCYGSRYTTRAGKYGACEDLIKIRRSPNGRARIDTIYEHKSRIDQLSPDDFSYVGKMKSGYDPNYQEGTIKRNSVAVILKLPASQLEPVNLLDLHTELIIGQGEKLDHQTSSDYAFDQGVLTLGFPSMGRVTRFILGIITDNIPEQHNWENYFREVSEPQIIQPTRRPVPQPQRQTVLI